MSFRNVAKAFARLSITLVVGCGGVPSEAPPELVASAGQAIAGGDIDADSTATVGIYSPGRAICSGALIAPNVVLTARHCVSDVYGTPKSNEDFCAVTTHGPLLLPEAFHVTTETSFPQDIGLYHRVREVLGLPAEHDHLCGADLAILILEESLEGSEATPIVPRVDTPIEEGDAYAAVGYGGTDGAGAGAGTRRRRDGLLAACVGAGCPPPEAPSFVEIAETEWRGDVGTCGGDSGGPAIDLEGRVIGILSRGEAGCTTPMYGHPFRWGAWIKEVTVYAASVGGYAAPPWAKGLPTDPTYSQPEDTSAAEDASCALRRAGEDPTTPVPWRTLTGASVVVTLAALVRLRRRRSGYARP